MKELSMHIKMLSPSFRFAFTFTIHHLCSINPVQQLFPASALTTPEKDLVKDHEK